MFDDLVDLLRESSDVAERQRAVDEVCGRCEEPVLRDVSLSGCDLCRLRLGGLAMVGVDLRGSVCRGVGFGVLSDCVLDGVDARGAEFPRLERCSLLRARLDGSFVGGRMIGCDFSEALLRGVRFGPVLLSGRSECGDNRFIGADLSGADLLGTYLVGCDFSEARFARARLGRADLSGCDLRGAEFVAANMVDANVEGARTESAVFDGCVVTRSMASFLEGGGDGEVRGLSVWCRVAGDATRELLRRAGELETYRFEMGVGSTGELREEKLLVTHGTTSRSPSGYAFDAESSEFLRMYPMDGSNELSGILTAMAADYADWIVDGWSVVVREGESEDGGAALTECLCGALDPEFRIGTPGQ